MSAFSVLLIFHSAKEAVGKNYAVETWDNDVELVSTFFSMNQLRRVSLEKDTDKSDEECCRRAANKLRNFTTTNERLEPLSFSFTSVYSEKEFKIRFIMPRALFERICITIDGTGSENHILTPLEKMNPPCCPNYICFAYLCVQKIR